MITVRRKLRANRRWGDVQRLCDYCGVAYYLSDLTLDGSGNLRCPKEGNGKDSVTLSRGNAEGAKRFSPQTPVYDSGSVDTSSNEDETTPPGILNTVAGWWQLNFSYGPGGVQNIANTVGGLGTLANGTLRQADPALRPDSINSFTYEAGDTMQTPLSVLGEGATRTPEEPDEILTAPIFWHRADDVILGAGGVEKIPDKIPTPFSITVSQNTDSRRPDHFTSGGLNNQAYFSFSGSDGLGSAVGTSLLDMTEMYFFAVCVFNSTPSNDEEVVDLASAFGEARILTDGTNFKIEAATDSQPLTTLNLGVAHGTGTWRLIETYWDGTTLSARQDGGTPVTIGLTGTMEMLPPFAQCSYGAGTPPMSVAETLFSSANCATNGERSDLIAYLNERYGESWT